MNCGAQGAGGRNTGCQLHAWTIQLVENSPAQKDPNETTGLRIHFAIRREAGSSSVTEATIQLDEGCECGMMSQSPSGRTVLIRQWPGSQRLFSVAHRHRLPLASSNRGIFPSRAYVTEFFSRNFGKWDPSDSIIAASVSIIYLMGF